MSKLENGNWFAMSLKDIREGVRSTDFAIGADQVNCSFSEYTVGHALDPQKEEFEQVSICLKGTCDYYIDGKVTKLTEGSWVTVPAGVPNFVYARYNDGPCQILKVSSAT